MTKSWISVGEEAIATDEIFDFWIGVALEYNDKETSTHSRGRKRKRAR